MRNRTNYAIDGFEIWDLGFVAYICFLRPNLAPIGV